jgi:hypothetical protein
LSLFDNLLFSNPVFLVFQLNPESKIKISFSFLFVRFEVN